MNIVYIGVAAEIAELMGYTTTCEPLRESSTTYKFEGPKYLDYEEYHEPLDEYRLHEQGFAVLYFTALVIVVFILRILYQFQPQTIKIKHLYEQKDFHKFSSVR